MAEASVILDKYSQIANFEDLLGRLQRDDREKLRSAIQILFSDLSIRRGGRKLDIDVGFCEKPDLYDELIQKLKIEPRTWKVISLNYDLLFEQAVRRAGIKFRYPNFPENIGPYIESPNELVIFKPHGSINFFAQADNRTFNHESTLQDDRGQITRYQIEKDGTVVPTYPIIFAGMAGAENVLSRVASWQICKGIMANYMFGKRIDTNSQTLLEVRRKALLTLETTNHLLVVGVRPISRPGDDDFVKEALGKSVPRFTYVAGTQDDCDAILRVHSNAEVVSAGLRKFIQADPA